MTEKDKKIIVDAEKNGTPIFVLTAKDKTSYETILDYHMRCVEAKCDKEHLISIGIRATEFHDWQLMNKNKVKLPD